MAHWAVPRPVDDTRRARAPWLPYMPILESESSIGNEMNWRLRCRNRAALTLYWEHFKQVYASELDLPETNPGIPEWYYVIRANKNPVDASASDFIILFRTRGKPSFYADFWALGAKHHHHHHHQHKIQ